MSNQEQKSQKYHADDLRQFAVQLLEATGMDSNMAAVVAEVLVDGDLFGHTTHGLALLAGYIDQIERKEMQIKGEPEILQEKGATLFLDGKKLPGPWLVNYSLEKLIPKAKEYGVATAVIKKSHHIACLASYLMRAIKANTLVMIASSDPAVQSVAPFGGTKAVLTPNPIAMGIPADSPFMIDISASITTNGLSNRYAAENKVFDEEWFIDAQGNPSNNPKVLFDNPPGTILPLGGLSVGHKGFGLGLMVEALTAGLAGFGRSQNPQGWGATVHITVYDLNAFGGEADFYQEMNWIGELCRTNPPREGFEQVRMPGDRALALYQQYQKQGVVLHPSIMPKLIEIAHKYEISAPFSIGA